MARISASSASLPLLRMISPGTELASQEGDGDRAARDAGTARSGRDAVVADVVSYFRESVAGSYALLPMASSRSIAARSPATPRSSIHILPPCPHRHLC